MGLIHVIALALKQEDFRYGWENERPTRWNANLFG